MATVQSYTKAGVDQKFASRSNMTLVHGGGGTPDLTAFPDAKTGDVLERSGDGARWRVIGNTLTPIEGRTVSVQGKTGAVTLTPSDIGAAPASHTHTKNQITDLNESTTATANSLARRDSAGRLVVSNPSTSAHATTKSYVDSEIVEAKKWANLTGVPSTFAPSSHTHTLSQITDLTLSQDATASTVAQRDSGGRVSVSTPTGNAHATTKAYVDSQITSSKEWVNLTGKPSTYPPSSHTHPMSDVTGLPDLSTTVDGLVTKTNNTTTAIGGTAAANKYLATSSNGFITVETPTSSSHPANKSYVDSQISAAAVNWSNLTGKPTTFPPDAHTHTIAQITDLNVAEAATASTVVQRDSGGRAAVGTPTTNAHATTKAYVDGQIVEAKKWSNLTGIPSTFTPSSHTHTIAQITDLTVAEAATGSTVVKRDASGRATVATPSSTNHAATKAYVDNAATDAKKWANLTGVPATFPPSAHTHEPTDINGWRAYSTNATDAGTVPWRAEGGHIILPTSTPPTTAAVPKAYVDRRPALFTGASLPPSSIPGAVVGDSWLDTRTMFLYDIIGV